MSHPGYMSKKLPWSSAARVTLVETAQGQSPASPMTAQHVFRPKPSRQITTTLPTKTGAYAPCAFTLFSKPCNQRAPKGLVTLSLGWSSRAGKAVTSIILGSEVMWVKYLGRDAQPPCHSDRQWSVSWAGLWIHQNPFLDETTGSGLT